ncbi:MAG: hypothetical protein QNJ97_18430 [Myxococcota bacterium]|nr:hypothetical protein [Myxococcota bacterium]
MKHFLHWAALFELVLATAGGCVTVSPYTEEPFDARYQQDRDRQPTPEPKETIYSGLWDRVEDRAFRPVVRAIDIPSKVRTAGSWFGVSGAKEAENINAWDEVPDSTWFVNRIGRQRLTRDALLRINEPGPDMEGVWTVIAGKTDGVTAGFTIKDRKGEMYFIKFDPPGFEALSTGAEIITTLIMNAAGYNVPHNHLLFVRPDRFVMGDGANIPGEYGVKREMTAADLKKILGRLDWRADGTVRLVASKAMAGKPIGPFLYKGTRSDDPNDRIPHQHRRELRGYHVISAWVNNSDILTKNTFDSYIGEPGKGFVRHYLFDFGSSLGSAGNRPKNIQAGYELYVDYQGIGKNLATLGFEEPYFATNQHSGFESIGIFEASNFDPRRWTPWWGNPTWEAITDRDAFWATRIIMRFTDEEIREIVQQAQYPEPGAETYMTQTLIQRRNKFGAVWFHAMTPLDDFGTVNNPKTGAPELTFQNLAVLYDYAKPFDQIPFYLIESSSEGEMPWAKMAVHAQAPGVHRVPLAEFATAAPTHLKISINLYQGQSRIGGGVDVFAYCWTKQQCIVTGLERLY